MAIPDDRSLALVGDADGNYIARPRARLSQSLQRDRNLGGSNLLWIMLNPPGLRKDLIELALSDGADCAFLIKQESARARRSLV
jgi:hypothetical protein